MDKRTALICGLSLWMAMRLVAGTSAAESAPQWKSLKVYPPQVKLTGAADYQNMIAVAEREDGVTVDVTENATWELDNPAIGELKEYRLLPVADGQGKLVAQWNGLSATTEVVVENAQQPKEVSFHLDIMPVLTRAGCNTGSCHGAARGKDGFRLSLFGFDPVGDYHRITREIGFRRINLAVPDQSLVYLKAIGAVPHSGGKRMEPGSVYAETLLAWLRNGAPLDATEPPKCTKVELFPPQVVLEGDGAAQRLVAVAHYSDGTTRDVTNLAAFTTNNERTAAVTDLGAVTAGVRGEAFVMARFDTHTVGTQVLALPAGLQYSAPEVTGNYIDQLVAEKLKRLRIPPSPLCTDEEFLRRVTIDIVGLLPTEEEYAEFMADTSPDKRAKWIDRLLERKEFSEIWAMKWAQLLKVKSNNQVSYKAAFLYSSWLTNKIANNTPIDQIVRELLASSGGVFEQPATNFYQVERDTLKTAENVAQVFMGIRTQCAQCHNHPFDRWTMDDYYGFASFFSQIGRKTGEDYREVIIFNRGGGEVNHPVTGKPVPPTFLGGPRPEIKGRDRREVLAEWITSPDNPYFATSIANRVWKHFMGVGIVDPVDDIRVSNPPSNPALFQELGRRLTEYQFDMKQLVRDICNSETYQRSTLPNDQNAFDTRNYAYAQVRRIPAEMLLDCISQATNTKDKFRGLPLGARAVQIADGGTSNYFLTTFGRSPRDTVCECEASTDPSLSQALHLINGNTTQGKISQGKLVATWLDQGLSVEEIIDRIYVRCLTRHPTKRESDVLVKMVAEAGDPRVGLEDAFWAVLNSREFMFNH
ncbi:MAG: surface protein [Pirellulaceae bacterium]|nr:MAG: surface protein [Pirellulaceae bacterium]